MEENWEGLDWALPESDEDDEDGSEPDDGDGSEPDDEDGSESDDGCDWNPTDIAEFLADWRRSAIEPERKEVVLQKGLWGKLPEDILCRILTRLPARAQSRFCCVSSRWNTLLSSSSPSIALQHSGGGKARPSCTILISEGSSDDKPLFFCHADQKWFKIPFDGSSCLELSWMLVSADAGLLCYQCSVVGKLWLCVCNPRTRSFQVIPSEYPRLSYSDLDDLACVMVKLIVDREAKVFKVALLLSAPQGLYTTVVFDSSSNSWTDFQCVPSEYCKTRSCFVRKSVMYFKTSHLPSILETFDINSGKWSQVDTELPWNNTMRLFFTSNRDQVMLVELNRRPEKVRDEPLKVWKHLDNIPDNSIPIFSAPRWEEVEVKSHRILRCLLSEVEDCFSYGSEYFCLTFSSTPQWVKYTYATKRWDVMPRGGPTKDLNERAWHVWEPGLDMVLSSRGSFGKSDHPELECLIHADNEDNY